jgi:DNA polymerase phi
MIFVKMLEELIPHQHCVEKLFSKNFMNCLINQAGKEDRFLHRAAVKALKAIEAAANAEPAIAPTLLRQLLGKHGAYNFDQKTNSRTVDSVLRSVDPLVKSRALKSLRKVFASKTDDE